ncbi:MAG TPA: HipA domain-containing protein [Gammaproteobacteria bacterium]|nr:HipA domain-containing protein [Gammaproteobacteria bacterium]
MSFIKHNLYNIRHIVKIENIVYNIIIIKTKNKLYFMAITLWGKVYYSDIYAGELQQEPGGRCIFTYDASYLNSPSPLPISFSFPLRKESFVSERGLHPFFDNLAAEGWLEDVQAKALQTADRFALLLGFGYDLAGAVSIIDPLPRPRIQLNHIDEIAALSGRTSLSGVQRKLMVVKEGNQYRPANSNELSTHIAKLSSGTLTDIIEVEYLTTQAVKKLLPDDAVVEMEIATVHGLPESALIIKRFDRIVFHTKVKNLNVEEINSSKITRIHFEEFNQLLGHYSGDDKYKGSYEDLGNFINTTAGCMPAEVDRLYRRILANLLVGNTDAHFKNFAMFHTRDGLRLTPSYDLVAANRYQQYKEIALNIGGAKNLEIGALKPKHIIELGYAFGLNNKIILNTVNEIEANLQTAKQAIFTSQIDCSSALRKKLIDMMEKRWKGSFGSIGQLLSKRQSKGGNRKI